MIENNVKYIAEMRMLMKERQYAKTIGQGKKLCARK